MCSTCRILILRSKKLKPEETTVLYIFKFFKFKVLMYGKISLGKKKKIFSFCPFSKIRDLEMRSRHLNFMKKFFRFLNQIQRFAVNNLKCLFAVPLFIYSAFFVSLDSSTILSNY